MPKTRLRPTRLRDSALTGPDGSPRLPLLDRGVETGLLHRHALTARAPGLRFIPHHASNTPATFVDPIWLPRRARKSTLEMRLSAAEPIPDQSVRFGFVLAERSRFAANPLIAAGHAGAAGDAGLQRIGGKVHFGVVVDENVARSKLEPMRNSANGTSSANGKTANGTIMDGKASVRGMAGMNGTPSANGAASLSGTAASDVTAAADGTPGANGAISANHAARANGSVCRQSELIRISHDLHALAYPGTGGEQDGDDTRGAGFVRSILRARRLRRSYIGRDIFTDQPWDILLELYASHLAGHPVSITQLCAAADVPGSTVLRWVRGFEAGDLVERRQDSVDGRRIHISLTQQAVAKMERLLTELGPTCSIFA